MDSSWKRSLRGGDKPKGIQEREREKEWKVTAAPSEYTPPSVVRARSRSAATPSGTAKALAKERIADLERRMNHTPELVDRQDWTPTNRMPPLAPDQKRASVQANLWSGPKELIGKPGIDASALGEPKAIASPGYMMDQTRAHYDALSELHDKGYKNPLDLKPIPGRDKDKDFQEAWARRSEDFASAPARAIVPVASHGLEKHPNPRGTIQAKEIATVQAEAKRTQTHLSATAATVTAAQSHVSSYEAANLQVTSAMIKQAGDRYRRGSDGLTIGKPAAERAGATAEMREAQRTAKQAVVRGKLHPL